MSWAASATNGGSAVSSYTVQAYDAYSDAAVGSAVKVCGTCTSATVTGLTNSTDYYVGVKATNGNNLSSDEVRSSIFTPGAAPAISKTAMDEDGTVAQSFSRGQSVTYQLTVSNPDPFASMSVDSVTDTLPATLQPAGTVLTVGGVACSAASSYPSCTVDGRALTVSDLQLDAGASTTIAYQAVAVGVDRACTSVSNAATASNQFGSRRASVPISVCGVGLGVEPWWRYLRRVTGPAGQALVNIGDGNLVVQQTDSTAVQAHGRLAYVLRRTYNSQDSTLLTLPGSVGAGWLLNVGQSDDLAGDGVGSTGLYVPPAQSVLQPLAVTLIDRDGTRHVFTPRALGASVDVTGLQQAALTGNPGPLGTLIPKALRLGTGYTRLCVDQTYDAPPGVHLGLWRYVQVAGTSCGAPASRPAPAVVGFAAVRPDRLRYEYSADGRMTDLSDAAGVDLRYVYGLNTTAATSLAGGLSAVYEPRSCPQADPVALAAGTLPPTCRGLRLTYPSSAEVDVTDSAARVTKYLLDGALPTTHLSSVVNPDGSTLTYRYGGCGGSADQLCAATDPRGAVTTFGYGAAPALGPARVTKVTDRRGQTATLAYTASPDAVTTDLGSRRQRYSGLDDRGRVGEIDEGDTSNTYLRQALYSWDAPGSTCRQPDNAVDNNLCRLVRKSLTSQTPDEDTSFRYNPEGKQLVRHALAAPGSVDATDGYSAGYFESDGNVRSFQDTVTGGGSVSSPGGARTDAGTLFAISDHVQSLTPRGNAAGSGFTPYLTKFKVDNAPSVAPGSAPAGTACPTPDTPTGNTGLVCEATGPSYDGTHPAVTRYTYDSFGQKLTYTTPNEVAGVNSTCPGGAPGTANRYSYFADSDLDLSGNVSAGGWLRAVSDPCGNFVAFGYDRAGDLARSWDRDATAGHQVTDFPGPAAAPPDPRYSETLYGAGSSALAAPWRYPRSQRDPLGNATSRSVDANGNALSVRPPRGTAAGTADYDTRGTFDPSDLLLTVQTPLESAAQQTRYSYDSAGNRTAVTDPRGNVTTYSYDVVNRRTGLAWTRGPWPTDTSTVPPACRQSTTADAPLPAGRIVCSSAISYDGVDNQLTDSDGNHQTTSFSYDGVHRRVRQNVPRNDGTLTTLRTDTVYDPDGHVTDSCPPREFTEGSGACTASAAFSTHTSFDVAGRASRLSTYRQHDATSSPPVYDVHSSASSYDADGNLTSSRNPRGFSTTYRYDALDRRSSMTVPRNSTSTMTTNYGYDPVGNTVAVTAPGNRITAYSYDADNRTVNTVVGASSADAALAGLAGADGGSNVRTRMLYDAESHEIGRFDPRAFTSSLTGPDTDYLTRVDFDRDGRPAATYQPRFDPATTGDPLLSPLQGQHCRTDVRPAPVPGAPAYPPTAAVCVTKIGYDAAGNRSRLTYPTSTGSDNRYTDFGYTDDNLPTTTGTPSPQTPGARVSALTRYDGAGRPVAVSDPLGHSTVNSYNADGSLAQVQLPTVAGTVHLTRYGYDAAGGRTKTTRVITAASATTAEVAATDSASYYSDGAVRDLTDGAGGTTRYLYDEVGNPTDVTSPSAVAKDATNPSGTATSNSYTADDLLAATLTPVSGAGTTLRRVDYGYDPAGRKTSVATKEVAASAPTTALAGRDAGQQTFSYYPDDRLQTQTGRGGATITTRYDADGHPVTVADSTGGSSTLTAGYYLDGLLRSLDDGARTTTNSYDGAGARTARADTTDVTAVRTLTRYGYNDDQLPVSVSSDVVGGASTTIGYDPAGRPGTVTLPNGTSRGFTFNDDDTLAAVSLSAGTSTLASWAYSYDGLRRITRQTLTGQAASSGGAANTGDYSYGYDNTDRLTSYSEGTGATASTIGYDHDGNRTSSGPQTFTYNPDDSIRTATDKTGANPKTSAYAAFGAVADDQTNSYCYDPFDRLSAVGGTATTGCAGASTVRYSYDGLDRQRTHTASTATGVVPANTTVTVHYDAASSAVGTETAPGLTDTSYELGPDGTPWAVSGPRDTGTAADATTPVKQYLADDGHGTITTAVADTGPTVQCTARFDPWGNPVNPRTASNPCSDGSTANSIFYRSSRRDGATGNYQLGARTYAPAKASFLTADSYRSESPTANLGLGTDPLTRNSYSYVNGDPVNNVDPDGHRTEEQYYGKAASQNRESQQCDAACQRDIAAAAGPAPQAPAQRQHHSALHNIVGGIGKGAFALGPGVVGDLASLLPWAPAQQFSEQVDQAQQRLQDSYGVDVDSCFFRCLNVATQVLGTVVDVGGAVVGTVRAVRAGARLIKAARATREVANGVAELAPAAGRGSSATIRATSGADHATPLIKVRPTGSRTAAEAGGAAGDHIVLGLRANGLEETAAKVGGRTLLGDREWMSTLQQAVGDSSTRFTVSLDGLSGSSTYSQVVGAAQRGFAGPGVGGYTDWELSLLYQADRLGGTTFVRGGVPVPNPFAP